MTRPTVLVYHADPRYVELMRVPKRGALVRTAATPREAAEPISEAEILYAWKFPPQLYAKAGRLKWLQVMGAGVDWALVPELPAGVRVTRVPGVFGPWMAEYVIGWCSWVTQRVEEYRQAQKLEIVGQLTGGVAHDFNNLLTAIRGYAQIALESAGADAGLRESLDEILLASERAAEVTRQLLAFSRRQTLRPRTFDASKKYPVIEAIYADSRYSRSIDYTKPLSPPLSDEEVAWLAQRLRERGV